ncbi:GFA family protein [Pseudanabaena sp. ABRG5-3]|uniref:GFA family protein n=1 Tax=Pseudanabaena sp. ABRG5-3 TaxID=685565 RepID=UPI000DC6DCBA|nr:GFA family protein [Pseudanabaena sp. ABRG5-3]BBC22707.1 glutathione-dependent formaldehyde-activating GFA [Pseudanabaena sp. ABRG5-3]
MSLSHPSASKVKMLGGCHCGAIRFQVSVSNYKALDCNCSICQKKGILHLIVPPEDFELLQGNDHLSTYTFNTGIAKHHFCKTCGIHPFYRPRSHPNDYDVNVRCLDGDAMSLFEIVPFNGRHWEENIQQIT